jgi:hypothetical protein
VNHWIKFHFQQLIKSIYRIMKEARLPNIGARLAQLTDLKAIIFNVTRWSGKYDMVARYNRIEEYLDVIPELNRCRLTAEDRANVPTLHALEDFNDVTTGKHHFFHII